MLILHANWYDGALCLWAESLAAYRHSTEAIADSAAENSPHPFAASHEELRSALTAHVHAAEAVIESQSELSIRLPSDGRRPQPSDRLSATIGTLDDNGGVALLDTSLPCLRLRNARAAELLLRLEDAPSSDVIRAGASLRYWTVVARFVLELLADQRFVPSLAQRADEAMRGQWQPWLHDPAIQSRVGALLAAMPPSARAPIDSNRGRPWMMLSGALQSLTDAMVREALQADDFIDAVAERDPHSDPHVAWLRGLLGANSEVDAQPGTAVTMLRDTASWIGRLDETGQDQPMKLCLRLNEPVDAVLRDLDGEASSASAGGLIWHLSLHLQAVGDSSRLIDAEALWNQPALGNGVGASSAARPQELLLRELGRASRVYPKIESALSEAIPVGIDLTTREAYEFLREHKPVLEESGFRVIVPRWWSEPSSRIGARLQIDSPEEHGTHVQSEAESGTPAPGRSHAPLGLNSLVQYQWQIAVGDQPLTMEEFQRLAQQSSPLVRVRGRWIEIRPNDMQRALSFLQERPGGEMTLLEAIQVAYGTDGHQPGLPVTGLDASGWVEKMLTASSEDEGMTIVDQPASFKGELRPYQVSGLSWLAFLDRFGLGACLADDMGLGKTIQLIALLLHERGGGVSGSSGASRSSSPPGSSSSDPASGPASVGPTLLIVPTSVVANWVRELARFAPELRVYVHHGPERHADVDVFAKHVKGADVVITTYALITRDRDTLTAVDWHRVALDEAQYIKNPPTKQTAAIRALRAPRRLALTGTPVENRLTELWSIMDFCNPGYLGPFSEFRRRFAIPVERHRDQRRADALRRVVRPFILRRLKTDPKVITDLPSLVETKEFATLTAEQAALYEAAVNRMLTEVDRAEGMQRRGLVLSTLVQLKQICNHPAQIESSSAAASDPNIQTSEDGKPVRPAPLDVSTFGRLDVSALSQRSGKARRVIELLEEVVASGEQALVFTQFRRMGHLLTAMIRNDLDCDSLFLHGGTPSSKRQEMIDRFQSGGSGAPPIFVLSLKAGGLGLNLTAANHVFHFDRWWNPAVENQATDRAFRIGQTRNVHVHKFICVGTLEERIDQMIEQKTELADNIIGSGESWLTELSTGQLHEMLTLRRSAMEVDA